MSVANRRMPQHHSEIFDAKMLLNIAGRGDAFAGLKIGAPQREPILSTFAPHDTCWKNRGDTRPERRPGAHIAYGEKEVGQIR